MVTASEVLRVPIGDNDSLNIKAGNVWAFFSPKYTFLFYKNKKIMFKITLFSHLATNFPNLNTLEVVGRATVARHNFKCLKI